MIKFKIWRIKRLMKRFTINHKIRYNGNIFYVIEIEVVAPMYNRKSYNYDNFRIVKSFVSKDFKRYSANYISELLIKEFKNEYRNNQK